MSAVPAVLMYGDTIRYPSLRHEVPLEILDPFLFVERDGHALLTANSLEAARVAEVLPDAELLRVEELGLFELVEAGLPLDEAELEVVVRAVQRWGIDAAVVPADLPVAVADRLRAAGVAIEVDARAVEARRRVKTPAELEGIRRAQRAAEAGMAVAEQLVRSAERREGVLQRDGEPLTAEAVRAAIRAACAAAGAPAPPDIMVTSLLSGGGHDPGFGPLPADLPITIDLWPRDEASGCWADMTRTFVGGAVSEAVAALRDVVREALEAARAAARPGISGRALYDVAAEIVERAGYPTQRTREPGQTLDHGFYCSLGHGVGLEVHEPPGLGLAGGETLVAGDVIAIEPGIEGLAGIGGVRFEDLLLITEDGSETLTSYPYDL
ncbi:MAG TPA: M24 family metallopeptidase [Solirubrobacteraceae bacterium]|nr:M24 family metallopeptidase [Solirubrobacteraceae bacterium]